MARYILRVLEIRIIIQDFERTLKSLNSLDFQVARISYILFIQFKCRINSLAIIIYVTLMLL